MGRKKKGGRKWIGIGVTGLIIFPDSVYERDRVHRERPIRHNASVDMVDDIWNCVCDDSNCRAGGKEGEIMNGNTLLGLIMLGMGIFGFIMAILTYPW